MLNTQLTVLPIVSRFQVTPTRIYGVASNQRVSNLVSREIITNDFTSRGDVIFVDIPFDPLLLNPAVGSSCPMSFSSGVNLFRNLRAFCTTSCFAATERERIFDSRPGEMPSLVFRDKSIEPCIIFSGT